jgi:transposase
MKDTQLYSQILGIEKPWKVIDVQISLADDEVAITVDPGSGKMTRP